MLCRCIQATSERPGYLCVAVGDIIDVLYIEKDWIFGECNREDGWCSTAVLTPIHASVHMDLCLLGVHAYTDGSTDDGKAIACGVVHDTGTMAAYAPGRFIGSAASELAAIYLCLQKFAAAGRGLILVIHTDSERAIDYAMEPLKDTKCTRRLRPLIDLVRDSLWASVRLEWVPRRRNLAHNIALAALRNGRAFYPAA